MTGVLIERAALIAQTAHQAVGQKRKYTGDGYFIHSRMVARIISFYDATPEMIAAAFLHDVLEDTQITEEFLREQVGNAVTNLVIEVTDVSKPSDGNRRLRKAIDRDHLAKASPEAQTIKLADTLDNISSIARYDPKFAKVYIREKVDLLEVMNRGNPQLYMTTAKLIKSHAEELFRS